MEWSQYHKKKTTVYFKKIENTLKKSFLYNIFLPIVSMVSRIISITTIVPVRPIPALDKITEEKSKYLFHQSKQDAGKQKLNIIKGSNKTTSQQPMLAALWGCTKC